MADQRATHWMILRDDVTEEHFIFNGKEMVNIEHANNRTVITSDGQVTRELTEVMMNKRKRILKFMKRSFTVIQRGKFQRH